MDDESSSPGHSRVKRRRKIANFKADSDVMVKTLRSIEKNLRKQACQEKDCFDLLSSYELKTDYFENLDKYLHARGLQLDFILSIKEQSFVNLVLKTDNLFILCRLMNENICLMKSIVKKFKDCEKHVAINS